MHLAPAHSNAIQNKGHMKKQGTVVRWNRDKAFGFIRSPDTVADIFFHRRDYEVNAEPIEGTLVTFEEIHVGGKGPRGLKVEPARNTFQTAKTLPEDLRSVILPRAKVADRSEPPHKTRRQLQWLWASLGLMALWLVLWLTAIGLGRVPAIPLLSGLVIVNIVTFYLYLRDKEAAISGEWRVSENQLHGLSLLGGWPGAWFAQQILRHKSSKVSFRFAYWATVAVHFAGLLGWLIWPALQTAGAH